MLIEAAHHYLSTGLCVLPAIRAQKRPAVGAWKRYQDRLPTKAELTAWFANHYDALCILCGRASGNAEIIDFDAGGEQFATWWDRLPPDLRDKLVVEQTPSGGYHVVYRHGSQVCGNIKLAQRHDGNKIVTLIETRGEGGLFLCAPTSGYEIIQGDLTKLTILSEIERDALLQAAWELNEYVPPIVDGPQARPRSVTPNDASLRPGDDFNTRGDVRAVLKRNGWTCVRRGDNEYWRRPDKSHGWSATLKDGVFYVFSANASPFEPSQAYSPFAVYALLEHGGDWQHAAAALRRQGFGSSAPSSDVASSSKLPGIAHAPVMLAPMTIRDLVGAYPQLRPPIIHGLLREGETMNIIASPKTGKSWLVTDLALSIATGRDWLEQFRCERGEVLILDNELHSQTSAHRIPKVAVSRQVPVDAYADRLWVQNLRGHLQDVFTLEAYFDSLEPGRFKVIILDAFYRFMPRDMDENDNGTMASLYNHIDRYADRLGCSFVLIHHTTKGSQSSKSVTDVGAGAGSQSRATDTHLILRPHEEEDAVVLDAAVRSWPPVSPCCLRWSFPVWSMADDLDPVQLRSENGKKRSEKKDEWTVEMFVDAFVSDQPATRSAILDKAVQAGLSHWLADRLLRSADTDGRLTRHGEGKRNEPFTYQRAALLSKENGR